MLDYILLYFLLGILFMLFVAVKSYYYDKIPVKDWQIKRIVVFGLAFPLVIIALIGEWLVSNIFDKV